MKESFLSIDEGSGPNFVYPLMADVTIGRSPDNAIVLPDPTVSRKHAKVSLQKGLWIVEDLRSANGIVHGGNSVDRLILNSGDMFQIGDYTFRFVEKQVPEGEDLHFDTVEIAPGDIKSQDSSADGGSGEPRRLRLPDAISRIPFLSHLGDAERKQLEDTATIYLFNAGEMIIREGDSGRSVYVILDGLVRVFTRDQKGEELELAVLAAGQFLGEISFFTGEHRSSSVMALDTSRLVELSYTAMQELIEEHPPLETVLLTYYRDRLADTKEKRARARNGALPLCQSR